MVGFNLKEYYIWSCCGYVRLKNLWLVRMNGLMALDS